MLSRLLTALVLGVLPLLALPSNAQSLPPPRETDLCAQLFVVTGDPFVEADRDRCFFVLDTLEQRDPGRLVPAFNKVCPALRAEQKRNSIPSGREQNCSAEYKGFVTMFQTTGGFGTLKDRAERLVANVQNLHILQSHCEFLARKYKDNKLRDNDACAAFEAKRYATSPAETIADYRNYCASLADSYPAVKLPAGTEGLRLCPHVSNIILTKRGVVQYMADQKKKLAEEERYYGTIGSIIVACIILTIIGWVVIAMRQRSRKAAEREARPQRIMNELLNAFGRTPDQRIAIISRSLEDRTFTLQFHEKYYRDNIIKEMNFEILRSIATMEPRELTALRALLILAAHPANFIDAKSFEFFLFALIYGDGRCSIQNISYTWHAGPAPSPPQALAAYAAQRTASTDRVVNDLLTMVDTIEYKHPDDPIVVELRQFVFGGTDWLAVADVQNSIYRVHENRPKLLLGAFPNGAPLTYSGGGALITIAPPGAGKTQCHVLPNLVQWPNSALVLDVKNEIYNETMGWRTKRVGPVFRFAPLDSKATDCFNPLTFLRNEPLHLWEDAQFLADMMVIKSAKGDPYWENRARDMLVAIIAYACYEKQPAERSMNVLHAVANRIGWVEFVGTLCTATDVPTMVEEGSSLQHIEQKSLDGILQTLKVALQPWAGQQVRHATRKSDWSPLDLRDGRVTIYLCVPPGQADTLSSVLRVFVGVHLRALTAQLPARDAAPILFMLDEMPRLRYMPPVEEALETGRQYGIWLWMFAQSVGQLRQSYRNADGMINSCAVQAYMNPGGHDGTAEHLSKQLGMREGPLDKQRRNLVEASELTGPEFRDDIILIGMGTKPARVRKVFAHQDPEITQRLGMPDSGPQPAQ